MAHKGMSLFEKNLATGSGFGALAGGAGLLGGLFGGSGLFGKPESVQQVDRFSQPQQSVMNNLLMQGAQNADFGPIEQREINRFQTQTVPGLAERFTSMGNGQRSSGFQQALGMAGAGLGQDLAAQRSQFGMQQLGMGLQPQFENVFRPRQAGGIEQGLGSIMQLLPLLMFL
jgi:hypothetical protein